MLFKHNFAWKRGDLPTAVGSLSISQQIPAQNPNGVSLVFNGAESNANAQQPILRLDNPRNLVLYSAQNLTGVTITISGSLFGFSYTEVVTPPNNNVVYSLRLFDTITSIVVTGSPNAAGTLSVGLGPAGIITPVTLDRVDITSPVFVSISAIADPLAATGISVICLADIDMFGATGITINAAGSALVAPAGLISVILPTVLAPRISSFNNVTNPIFSVFVASNAAAPTSMSGRISQYTVAK